MTRKAGSATDFWTQALHQAARGKTDEAVRLIKLSKAVDKHQEIARWRFSVIDCLVALHRRRPEDARAAAQVVCGTDEGRIFLRTIMEQQQESLPTAARHLLSDLLRDPEAHSKSSVRPIVASAVAVLLVAVAGGTWFMTRSVPTTTGTLDVETAQLAEDTSAEMVLEDADTPNAADAASQNDFGPPDYDRLRSLLGRVIVLVDVLQPDGRKRQWPLKLGTAFVVTRDGYMVTNKHVVEVDQSTLDELREVWGAFEPPYDILGVSYIVAFGPDRGQWYDARPIETSSFDIALLKIEEEFDDQIRFVFEPDEGTPVWTIGFPGVADDFLDYMSTVDSSSREKLRLLVLEQGQIPDPTTYFNDQSFVPSLFGGSIGAFRNTEYGRMIQTDATIYSGMSGGPMLNARGEAIGVNTLGIRGMEGVGQAISRLTVQEALGHVKGIEWPDHGDR